MPSRSDTSEPSPAQHRPTIWGLDIVEAILLVLAVLVAGAAVVLLVSSKEAAGATMLVGVLVAVGSFRTIRITQQGQVTERFTRAIEQLGHDKRDVRLGGIYALERIALDSPDYHAQIMEVLTAYVAEHAPWPREPSLEAEAEEAPQAPAEPDRPKDPDTDVQAVIAVLGRRDTSQEGYRLHLAWTDLEGAKFAAEDRGNFQEADFSGAHLEGAHLRGALFKKADLKRADLSEAELEGTDLREANLEGADLETAKNLDKADLHGAVYDLSSPDGTYRGTRWPKAFDFKRAGARLAESDGTRDVRRTVPG